MKRQTAVMHSLKWQEQPVQTERNFCKVVQSVMIVICSTGATACSMCFDATYGLVASPYLTSVVKFTVFSFEQLASACSKPVQ
jgi:hypothetical protein